MRRSSRLSVTWLRFSVFGILLVLGYLITSRPDRTRVQPDFPSYSTDSNACINSPLAGNVVVSVKTGASEATERLPAQMQTTLRCAKNVVFFSDLEQDVKQYHLHDSLDTISTSVIDNNPDFVFYRKQAELWKSEQDISSLKGFKHPESHKELAAWTLDKYKNVHILEKTWALKPNMDWYIFIDADTYIFWSNMLMWLETMDPMKKSYFGSEVNIDNTRFAHGGTGIIISKATMYELAVTHNGTAERWDPKIHEKCCGDLVLGLALKEFGTELQDVWPLMSGETQTSMPFGPGTPEYWCRPALSLHHLSPTDMKDLDEFERGRPNSSDILNHVELFKSIAVSSLKPYRDNWDNLASEPGEFGKTGGVALDKASFEECTRACEADEKCFQYTHHGNTCYIGMSVRVGHKKDADEKGIWKSGWNQTRLTEWISKQPSCDHIKFPEQGA